MNLFLVIGFPIIATPPWSVANLVVSNGSALRMVLEMIWMTPEMTTTTTMTTTNFSMPRKN